jgi:outer membrane receptor protein involved in Fe transport
MKPDHRLEENVSSAKGNHEIQFEDPNTTTSLTVQAQGRTIRREWTSSGVPMTAGAFLHGQSLTCSWAPDHLSTTTAVSSTSSSSRPFLPNDKWRVTPRLTLNLGLRWDSWTPYREKYDRLDTADDSTVATKFEVMTPDSQDIYSLQGIPPSVLDSWSARGLTYTTADAIGYPSKLFSADNNNFGPRLGAAFKINDKTVLRGGYGEYFWTMPLSQSFRPKDETPADLIFQNDYFERTLI